MSIKINKFIQVLFCNFSKIKTISCIIVKIKIKIKSRINLSNAENVIVGVDGIGGTPRESGRGA